MGWLNLAACMLLAGLVTAHIAANRRRDPTDSFRMFGVFRRVIAISTSSNDTSFKCLKATLTRYEPREKKATYVWHLRAHGDKPARDVTFDIEGGDIQDQVTYFVNNDCMMWVKRSVVHNVPQNCLDHYEQTCEVRIPQFEHDLCGDEE